MGRSFALLTRLLVLAGVGIGVGIGCGGSAGETSLCGDGIVDRPVEQCDDGNQVAGDGCSSRCLVEVVGTCGNGVVEAPEQCDDGNTASGDGCSANCRSEGNNTRLSVEWTVFNDPINLVPGCPVNSKIHITVQRLNGTIVDSGDGDCTAARRLIDVAADRYVVTAQLLLEGNRPLGDPIPQLVTVDPLTTEQLSVQLFDKAGGYVRLSWLLMVAGATADCLTAGVDHVTFEALAVDSFGCGDPFGLSSPLAPLNPGYDTMINAFHQDGSLAGSTTIQVPMPSTPNTVVVLDKIPIAIQ